MFWPFNHYPGTDYETFNWDWLISTVKQLQNTVDNWVNNIKDYVLEILSDHPEWIQNWMLDDGSVAWNNLAEDVEKRIVNNSEAMKPVNLSSINYILELAKPYMDDASLVYDSALSPFAYGPGSVGRGLTCSDWGVIALYGIKYNDTTWFGSNNPVCPYNNADQTLLRYKYGNNWWSEQIAKYIDDNNLSYTPNNDLSNVAPGDLLFFDLHESDNNDPMYYPPTGETTRRYKGVDHCAVFVQKPNDNYYTVLEVQGPTDGRVVLYNCGMGSRKMVTALRNPMNNLLTVPEVVYSDKPIISSDHNSASLIPTRTIKEGEWVTVVTRLTVSEGAYLVATGYNTSDGWFNVFSQASMMYNVFQSSGIATMLFRAPHDIERFGFNAVPITAGDNVSMNIDKCTIYQGIGFDVAAANNITGAGVFDIANNKKDITPLVGSAYSSYGGCYYYKIGSRVVIHLGMEGLTPNTTQTVFNMPAGYRPYSAVNYYGQNSAQGQLAELIVNPSGSVQVYSQNQYCRCEVMYDAII